MSRVIDADRIASGDLDDDEVAYLAQRDQLPASAAQQHEATLRARKLLASSPPPLNEVPNTGTVNTVGITREQLAAMGLELLDDGLNPPEQFENQALGTRSPHLSEPTEGTAQPLPEDGEDDEEEETPPYSAWTKRELAAEIHRRNEDREEDSQLSLAGNREDLINTLEADDAS